MNTVVFTNDLFQDVLRVIMFRKITRDLVTDNVKIHAPVVYIDKSNYIM